MEYGINANPVFESLVKPMDCALIGESAAKVTRSPTLMPSLRSLIKGALFTAEAGEPIMFRQRVETTTSELFILLPLTVDAQSQSQSCIAKYNSFSSEALCETYHEVKDLNCQVTLLEIMSRRNVQVFPRSSCQPVVTNQTFYVSPIQPNFSPTNLPACQGSNTSKWDRCFGVESRKFAGEFVNGLRNGVGAYTYDNGDKFVGEFKNHQRNGRGVEYKSDGTVITSGNWVNGKLISYALDTSQFPFDWSSQISSANQPSSTERDRIAAEVEAERKKRQELEHQLASIKERDRIAAELDAERKKRHELQVELDRVKELTDSRFTERPRPQLAQRPERRVALVIGNAQYKSSPLENSVNDATDIDQTLKRFGFQTTFLRNASLSQMREATRRFADQLTNADVALIYFAGHGIESKNKNYMIPVNADLKFEYELADQAYDAGAWLEMLEMIKSNNAERVNIVILDACRNNNLIGSRSLNRGLARMDAPTGTFLSYSTAPGKVAADGGRGERNSPFTKNLLRAMQQPGQPIEEVFKEVRRNVTRETNGAQVPWESTSLTGFFSFRQTR